MSSDEIVIDVRHLSKRYEIYATPRDRLKQIILPRLHRTIGYIENMLGLTRRRKPLQYYREFWALRDVSFQVRRGETVGIIGRNGSGKSTLLQILAGTLTPTDGTVSVCGRIAALLELGSGFNPEFTGRENVFLNGRILGLSQKEIDARYDSIVEFADIGAFIDEPVKTYSSGMFVRLAFAVQAHIDASVVIIDEALAVGDIFFRQKCYARLEQLRKSGAAILLVSHAMPDIEQYCETAILLNHGAIAFNGQAPEAAKHYYLLHQTEAYKTPSPVDGTAHTRQEHLPINEALRPADNAFLDLSGLSQATNGQALCTGIALCDDAGGSCYVFRQGDIALFHYEFELSTDIDVPICGVVIRNERGVIVHGKNSWQCEEDDAPVSLHSGTKVLCRQEIKLDLGPGEYVFEVGLASVLLSEWKDRANISHERISSSHIRMCHIANAGSFSVGLAVKNKTPVLTHHGIANLPGTVKIFAIAG